MFDKIMIAVFFAVFLTLLLYTILRGRKILKNGIEAEAVVSQIKESESTDADGVTTTDYIYFVNFQNEKGEIVEARLGNPPRSAVVGTQINIKYLPEKPNFVVMVKKI